MLKANAIAHIFKKTIEQYHVLDSVDQAFETVYPLGTIEHKLSEKNWIDTVQWHYEDLVRDPNITAEEGIYLKRKIDRLNQQRTDLVELIDDYFYENYKNVPKQADATINTESPAWAVDRLSILCLKLYHMEIETLRTDVDQQHILTCASKLNVLQQQFNDLTTAIDQLLDAFQQGTKYIKVYRQMKMYNDPKLNPVLYQNK